jgi:hypothetical protein
MYKLVNLSDGNVEQELTNEDLVGAALEALDELGYQLVQRRDRKDPKPPDCRGGLIG